MRRREALMVTLVYFDDEKGRDEGEQTEALDDIVEAGSDELLTRCAGWLEDEGALNLKEESYGVKKLYRVSHASWDWGWIGIVGTHRMTSEEHQRLR